MKITNVTTVDNRTGLEFNSRAIVRVESFVCANGIELNDDFEYEDNDCIVNFKCIKPVIYDIDEDGDVCGELQEPVYKIKRLFKKKTNKQYYF